MRGLQLGTPRNAVFTIQLKNSTKKKKCLTNAQQTQEKRRVTMHQIHRKNKEEKIKSLLSAPQRRPIKFRSIQIGAKFKNHLKKKIN